jgi:hypothetical protein
MSLKLIPLEDSPINFQIKPLSKKRRKIKNKITALKNKIAGDKIHRDDIMVHKCAIKLFHFVQHTNKYSSKQISSLIHQMHRSILSLERRKNKILNNKKHRK